MRSWLFLFNSLKRLAIKSWSNIKLAIKEFYIASTDHSFLPFPRFSFNLRINFSSGRLSKTFCNLSKSPRFSFWVSSNMEICVIIFREKHSFLMWFEHLHYTPLWLIKGAFLFAFIYTVMEDGLLYSKWRWRLGADHLSYNSHFHDVRSK